MDFNTEGKELQIQLYAIAQVLEGVETKGFDNMNRLLSAIRELKNLAQKYTPKETSK